tara:strand:+ start:402 stop:2855 length:2454 start_codon:yes stop_codon:yes gene_type:complete
VSGELSPLLKGRIDLTQYYQGVQTAKNLVIVPQGGMKRRPGTEYVQTVINTLTRNTTVPTVPNGGTAGNVNDDDDTTVSTTTSNISTTNPYVVCKFDLGSAKAIEFLDVRNVFLSAGTSSEFKIQYSTDDATYIDAATVPLLGVSSQNFRLFVGKTARYWRLARIGATDLGTAKITVGTVAPMEQTATASNFKMLDFSVEDDRHYLLVLTENNIRVFRTPNTHVADIKTTISSSNVGNIRDTQVENVMLLFQEDTIPQRLINLSTDTDWFIDNIPFSNVPQYDYNDSLSPTPVNDVQVMTLNHAHFVPGDKFQIDIEGVVSKNITFAGDSSADEIASTVFNIQRNIQEMPVMGETGVSVARTGTFAYTITVGGESAKDFELYSAFATTGTASKTITFTKSASGSPRREDVWSANRGYPKTACFYEGRLVLGGTKSKPQSLIFSKSGSFFDFDIDDGDDDEAIFVTISSRKLNDIVDVFPGRNLQVFTSGAEFAVTSKPVTPSSASVAPQTSNGASNIEVQEVDGSTIFVDRNGKSLRDFVFSFNEDAYVTQDLSVLASHLIVQPIDMALLTGTQSDDANWLFFVNADGNGTILNTLRAQDITGFTRWENDGDIKGVCVVDEDLYLITQRTINGAVVKFLERWDFTYKMDASKKFTPTASQTVLTGLDNLEGQTVQIVADAVVLQPRAVSSGSITLEATETGYTSVEVGLNFAIELKPMPVNTNVGSGQNQMRVKRIVRINARVFETSGVYVNGNAVPIRAFGAAPDTPLDNPPDQLTGIIEDIYDINGWTREEMPLFTVPDPTPCHIQMIEYEVESS